MSILLFESWLNVSDLSIEISFHFELVLLASLLGKWVRGINEDLLFLLCFCYALFLTKLCCRSITMQVGGNTFKRKRRVLPVLGITWSEFYLVRVLPGPGFIWSGFYLVRVLPGPGFTLSGFYLVRVLTGPGFTWSGFYLVRVLPGLGSLVCPANPLLGEDEEHPVLSFFLLLWSSFPQSS